MAAMVCRQQQLVTGHSLPASKFFMFFPGCGGRFRDLSIDYSPAWQPTAAGILAWHESGVANLAVPLMSSAKLRLKSCSLKRAAECTFFGG